MARREPELAYKGSIFRTVPNAHASFAVTAVSATEAGALAPYAGRWVWLHADGADITIKRGTHTMTPGIGLLIPAGAREEFFVAVQDNHDLSHISAAAATLVILFDTEAV